MPQLKKVGSLLKFSIPSLMTSQELELVDALGDMVGVNDSI